MYPSPPSVPLPLGPGDFMAISNGTSPDQPADKITSNWSSLIGIITAIVGNVLIALALNVQRYAHIRLHRQRARNRERAKQALKNASNGQDGGSGYGTVERNGSQSRDRNDEVEAQETDRLAASFQSGDSRWTEYSSDEKVASTYLKSPYWWLGQVLITVGEMGNFLAYGFAPASIVSPLGVVALVSNCVIAPILFKEEFRHRDFWGVIIAMTGAVTVVLSAKQEETKLEPHDVWDAISTTEFEVYMGVTCGLIIFLMWASPRYGNRTILIDLGLVGLYGGYTVLATKGVSSMLSSTLFGAFTTPVTYVLIVILVGTAVMQVRYVNKALQRFDSTQVIPIQFVMFTLCVIIGSAVLYRDFERTTAEQALKFVGGCLLTFFGVFIITSGRRSADEDEDGLSDVEGVEETIGLSEQASGQPQSPTVAGHVRDETRGSRRSSRASRVSFKEGINKSLTVADTGVPSLRMPGASASRISIPIEGGESSPLLRNPWQEQGGTPPAHPGMGFQALSSESIVSSAATSTAGSEGGLTPSTPLAQHQLPSIPSIVTPTEAPITPRPSMSSSRPHSHHFQGPMYSPSPLSSVGTVVADRLLRHIDSPRVRRVSSRRSRPSLRSSLFVPQDELDDEAVIPDSPASRLYHTAEVPDQSEESNGGGSRKGFRGRARTLSNTLSELLGGKRKRHNSSQSDNEDDADIRRPPPPLASVSTETV